MNRIQSLNIIFSLGVFVDLVFTLAAYVSRAFVAVFAELFYFTMLINLFST